MICASRPAMQDSRMTQARCIRAGHTCAASALRADTPRTGLQLPTQRNAASPCCLPKQPLSNTHTRATHACAARRGLSSHTSSRRPIAPIPSSAAGVLRSTKESPRGSGNTTSSSSSDMRSSAPASAPPTSSPSPPSEFKIAPEAAPGFKTVAAAVAAVSLPPALLAKILARDVAGDLERPVGGRAGLPPFAGAVRAPFKSGRKAGLPLLPRFAGGGGEGG
mmetsp:Transcript_34640/g.79998  ORF Transcript_34640/g.79998 Transcript_34640/m.79998 type:complete len:221 (-) Transcript_34640:274-936(-)